MNTSKKALVLSGGSIKGAFQAGAIKAVLESGFKPDIITGISVGTLSGLYMASEAGRMKASGKEIDWPEVGNKLYQFWQKSIQSPKDIVKKKTFWAIARAILGTFKGMTTSKPIDDLIRKEINFDYVKASGLELYFGAVNLYTGEIEYATPSHPNFEQMVLASKAIPIAMEYVYIKNQQGEEEPWYDGGVRDSAGLKVAMKQGKATEIQCVFCHPEKMDSKEIKEGSLLKLANRLADFHTNETLTNDIDGAKLINEVIRLSKAAGEETELCKNKHHVHFHPDIRPVETVNINLQEFNKQDIARVMENGYLVASDTLNSDELLV